MFLSVMRSGRRAVRCAIAGGKAALIGSVMLAACLVGGNPLAAEQPVTVKAEVAEGYGRIVLSFPESLPDHAVRTTTGVVVINFDRAVSVDVSPVAARMPEYVGAARRDADGRALRFALAQPVTLNTTEAGEKLFIDLLPKDWAGPPPGLPQAVIDELERRAEEAERRREEQERLARLRDAGLVELRVATLPTLARFLFEWEAPVTARIERRVDSVRVVFDEFGRLDTAGLRSQLPPHVSRITARNGDDGLEVELTIDPESSVRGFTEESNYVVDVTVPSPETYDDPLGVAGLPAAASQVARFPGAMVETDFTAPSEDTDVPEVTTRREPLAEGPHAEEAALSGPDGAPEPPARQADTTDADEPVRVEARRFGSTARLVFPFPDRTASAIFEYAGALWLVFDSARQLDVRSLEHDLAGLVSRVEVMSGGQRTRLRLVLDQPTLTSVSTETSSWIVTLGDAVLETPTPLAVARAADAADAATVSIGLPGAHAVHEWRDPESGHALAVVTAVPPAHGIVKPHNFVDFSLQPSLHGVAVQRTSDDVTVRLQDAAVEIARPEGLRLSLAPGEANRPLASLADGAARPGFVDGVAAGTLDPGGIRRLISDHLGAVVAADEDDRSEARLRLTQALLSSDLGAEALGELRLIADEDPAALRRADVRALRGVAKTLMHRPREALAEFDMYGLGQSTDVALWRGIAEAQLGKWREADASLGRGQPALASYPVERRRAFGLTAVRAALELGDPAAGAVRLAQLRDIIGAGDPELALLEGRLAEMVGDTRQALRHYRIALGEGASEVVAEARLRHTLARHRSGEIDVAATIDALESLALAWRGDDIELATLRHLAGLHVAADNHRRGFELMKSATFVNPESRITRALQDDMNRAFEALFLEGGANDMPPIEALALYYDFRELTPIGAKGDRIIRWLADRLVEVDLLDQAAELLTHQVEHRLSGAARAEVAAQLGLIHLMRGEPGRALTVLARTRQAVLPRGVTRQRMLIEARALGETRRTELALDMLARLDDGADAERLRAEVLWSAERWQEAGASLERLARTRWLDRRAFDEQARHDALRAAIAFALADDASGIDRVRARFRDQMAASDQARAFEAVTQAPSGRTGEFRAVLRDVSGLDTLGAFLEEYRARYSGGVDANTPQS